MKRLQIPQKLVYKKFYVLKKNYVAEIAAVYLSKIYCPKNAKKNNLAWKPLVFKEEYACELMLLVDLYFEEFFV